MKMSTKVFYAGLGFLVASFTISLTGVSAQVSEGLISRVFITNGDKDPVSIVSKDELRIKGEVKIDGNPEVKLNSDSKIKIESVEKPVTVRFDKGESISDAGFFKKGDTYLLTISALASQQRCKVDKIEGTWIKCERKGAEAEITGWVNTAQVIVASEL